MEEIYKKYSRLVYHYLYKLTNNSEISEELTQETFYDAIQGIDKFREECSLSVWLCQNKKYETISYNDNLDYIISDENFEEKIASREELIDFYTKIHKLDINTREVIYLKINRDFSFKEIGRILGKNEQWGRITFYRGKLKLKEFFKNEK